METRDMGQAGAGVGACATTPEPAPGISKAADGFRHVSGRIPVYVYAEDPVLQAGVASQIRRRPEILVVDEGELDSAAVAVVVADLIDDSTVTVIRAIQRNGCPRVIVVAGHLDDASVLMAVEAGACGFLRRREATPERMVGVLQSVADGNGTMPPDMLGRFLGLIREMQTDVLAPRGLTLAGLTDREIQVLRMVAEGLDTAEIADRLCYSERTVKNIVHGVTARLHLRNRSHAVAYAMRHGLI
jgi:DNA-binding NarL/FixJ family response regulator